MFLFLVLQNKGNRTGFFCQICFKLLGSLQTVVLWWYTRFPGKDVVAVDSPCGRLGLTVCYDLRFPEIYQCLRFQHQVQVWKNCVSISVKLFKGTVTVQSTYTVHDTQVLLVPSAFTKITGEAHWEILLRARAIETQCYVRTWIIPPPFTPCKQINRPSFFFSPLAFGSTSLSLLHPFAWVCRMFVSFLLPYFYMPNYPCQRPVVY